MTVDLHRSLARGGFVAAVVDLVEGWWEVPLAPRPRGAVDLLAALQASAHRLPWPQDRVLPAGGRRTAWGEEVVAEENQAVWEAVAGRAPDGSAQAVFFRHDGRERLDEGLALDELLFRITVEAAACSGPTRLAYRPAIDSDAFEGTMLVGRRTLLLGEVQFPALFGGPGWLALRLGHLVTNEAPTEALTSLGHLGDEWNERVRVEKDPADAPPGASPWDDVRALPGWTEEWHPVPRPDRPAR